MKRLAGLSALALAAGLAGSPALARDLVVALREESVGAATREAYADVMLRPLGVPLVTWSGGLDQLRTRLGDWDLVSLAAIDGQTGCDQALFEKLDWTALGGRDHYGAPGVGDCTVGAFAWAVVLAWDHDKLTATPTWADFWDIAKFPGKRGLARSVQGNLEIALMADGVAPADVYRVLRGSDGVARAFRKLDQLKPYLVFWPSGIEAARMLGSGDVLMTSGPDTAFAAANRGESRHFAVQWAGGIVSTEVWAIPKGSPNVPAATKLLSALGDAKLESRLPAAAGLGGWAKGANDGLPADQQGASPTLQANLDRSVPLDEAFWRDNRDKLTQQFDAWLAR